MIEVTSNRANKENQINKENRIRDQGGTYIKDRKTGKMLDVSQIDTRILRLD
jgi:hypothetical protein